MKQATSTSNILACVTAQYAPLSVKINVDNHGAISTTKNWLINSRNKHMDIRFHLFREALAINIDELAHCASLEQIADPTTEALMCVLHQELADRIGILYCLVEMSNV